jgi:hypothetical protein
MISEKTDIWKLWCIMKVCKNKGGDRISEMSAVQPTSTPVFSIYSPPECFVEALYIFGIAVLSV